MDLRSARNHRGELLAVMQLLIEPRLSRIAAAEKRAAFIARAHHCPLRGLSPARWFQKGSASMCLTARRTQLSHQLWIGIASDPSSSNLALMSLLRPYSHFFPTIASLVTRRMPNAILLGHSHTAVTMCRWNLRGQIDAEHGTRQLFSLDLVSSESIRTHKAHSTTPVKPEYLASLPFFQRLHKQSFNCRCLSVLLWLVCSLLSSPLLPLNASHAPKHRPLMVFLGRVCVMRSSRRLELRCGS